MNDMELNQALTKTLSEYPGTSDFNFSVGQTPQIEVHGQLKKIRFGPLENPLKPEDTQNLAALIMGDHSGHQESMERLGAADCAYSTPEGTRFRVNVFLSRGNVSIVLRVLSSRPPTLEELNLPPLINQIPEILNGMVLVTGATGAGKTTTLAAIIDQINRTRPVHVVTLEDPIEFVHNHNMATVNQREQGLDFFEFSDGLRSALRQAPKVILVGEMRDRETMEIGLKASETGHLVLSTLHTIDAGQTINRAIGMFPMEERRLIASRLSQVLRFVVGQRLLPKADGGRIPAMEIMGSNLRVRELIQSGEGDDKTFYSAIADSKPIGWQTFDQHIIELFEQGLITAETAKSYCSDYSVVNTNLDRIRAAQGENTSDIVGLEMERPRKLKL